MASKKEHRRRQKSKNRPAPEEKPVNRFQPVDELNSLSLSAAIPRKPEDGAGTPGTEAEAPAPETIVSSSSDGAILAVTPEADGPADTEEERAEVQAAVEALKQAEAAERARMEELTANRLRQQAEEMAELRQREEAEKQVLAQARQAEEEEAERVRGIAAAAEQARRDEEAAEAARRDEEAAEQARRQEELVAERARKMAEEAEQARRVAEQVAAARREAEEAERREQEAKRQHDAEVHAQQMAEAAERVRHMTQRVEAARREAEQAEEAYLAAQAATVVREEEAAREKADFDALLAEVNAGSEGESGDGNDGAVDIDALVAEARGGNADAAGANAAAGENTAAGEKPAEPAPVEAESPAPASAPTPAEASFSAPPLEVDNPYWENSPPLEMMSGQPHGAPPANPEQDAAGVLPASLAQDENTFVQAGFIPEESIAEKRLPDDQVEPVPPEKRMYIVMITPEVAPCAKVGGLGDVILGLGRELMKRGHGVEVICPMYSSMRYDQIQDLHEEYGELWSPHYNEWRAEKVFQGKVEGGLQVNFITGGTYTERDAIYGYADDLERFTYFSRQALEFMYKTNRRPDIIHCHDWATGLVPVAYWDLYAKLGWDNSRFVYTIHNNECQGLCGFSEKLLGLIGLNFREFHRPDRLQDDARPNCINMMKGGIVYSNFVTTVSPTYAGELKTVAGGRGLQNTITRHSAKVGGVLNGIDYDSWNPRTDPKLSARYSEGDDFFEKYNNKKALREWLGLYDAWKPIVSVVTRLTHQKGLDLIKHAIFATLKREGQFVLLGSAPDPKVNAEFLQLQHELRDNHDCNLYIGYHEDLSRLIYAGSDMFLVPSLYEPCGLTQMISLRYGTVPVVRETGGLVDTVFDLDNSGRGLSEANGFTFRDPTTESLDYALNRALRLWYDNPEGFNRLARNGMRYDYSWRHPAEHYENIYHYIKA